MQFISRKKNFRFSAFIVFLLFLIGSFDLTRLRAESAPFSGGVGTTGDPYIITTPAQLDEARGFLDAHYKLGGDIDLSSYLAPGGAGYAKWGITGWAPIGTETRSFIGSFDGAGHVITGLWIDNKRASYVGLFGYTRKAVIKNLGVEIAAAGVSGVGTGMNYIGGLVGSLAEGSIENSYVTGSVSGKGYVGGLVGIQSGGSIENSFTTGDIGDISDSVFVGGLVGNQSGGSIKNSFATGNISGFLYTGGLAGNQSGGSIENSCATGDITGYLNVGGLVGSQTGGSVENSLATGDVNGDSGVGGLVGLQEGGSIEKSFATGNVNGNVSIVGGLVGNKQNGGIITNCYRYMNQRANGAVLPTSNPDSAPDKKHGGVKTTTELMTQETYTSNGWLFYPSGPWRWDSGGFPKLNIGTENCPFKFVPTIINQLQNLTVSVGNTVKFGVTAVGEAPLSYQWQRLNNENTWINVGANRDIYSFIAQTEDDGAQFRVVVSNDLGRVISSAAILTMGELSVDNETTDNLYIITTAAELDAVRRNLSGNYILSSDIDLSSYLAPGGDGYAKWGEEGWLPIGTEADSFSGSFDGDGHVITGLWIDRRSASYAGLFGYARNAAIKNLELEINDKGAKGGRNVGGLVGSQFSGSITNSSVKGDISGGIYVGGLVGSQFNGSIVNSCASGVVKGGDNIGGLVGYLNDGIIINSYASVNISGGICVGGLVGSLSKGSIENCYATGDVDGYRYESYFIGGLVGVQTNGSITNSYATGVVKGSGKNSYSIGGLVGGQLEGSIENCYATGNVIGPDGAYLVGGLVGKSGGNIENCYATGNISGSGNSIGGLVGNKSGGSIRNSYAVGNVDGRIGIGVGGLVGSIQIGSSIINCYRYLNLRVNGNRISKNDPDNAPDKRHGYFMTERQLTTQETYTSNDWLFYPSGPWRWDRKGFPKLNIGVEEYPFSF